MLARQAGAPVPEVVTAGATIDGDAFVLRTTGTALDEYAPEAVGGVPTCAPPGRRSRC